MSSGGLFAVRCPGCGQALSVTLANHEKITCDACGYSGPLSPETAERLRGVFGIIKGLGESERHLTKRQKKTLTSSARFYVAIVLITLFCGLPSLFWLGFSILVVIVRPQEVSGAILFGTPGVILLVVTLLCTYLVVRSRRALASSMVAAPPAREGEPATCRLCGAPLVTGQEAVVRCGYCDTDNVVAAAYLTKATRGRAMAIEDFERETRRKISNLKWSTRLSGCALLFAVFGVPVPTFFFMLFAGFMLLRIEGPLNEVQRYALLETESGQCVASLGRESRGKWLFVMGSPAPPGKGDLAVPVSEDVHWVELEDLVGKEVCHWPGPTMKNLAVRGTVERVHGTVLGYNRVVINGLHLGDEGFCLIETPDYECKHPPPLFAIDAGSD